MAPASCADKGRVLAAFGATAVVSAALGGLAVHLLVPGPAASAAAASRALATRSAHRQQAHSWDYDSIQDGNWPEINPDCDAETPGGQYQAPINIALDVKYPRVPDQEQPRLWAEHGGCKRAFFGAEQMGWKVSFVRPDDGANCGHHKMQLGKRVYTLLQFHFHTLSEDTLDFVPAPMQVHMVHVSQDNHFAAIGVLIDTRGHDKNEFLDNVFGLHGFEHDRVVESHTALNPYEGLLNIGDDGSSGKYWTYQGGLTTPPCFGGIQFLIAQDTVSTRSKYVEAYRAYLAPNTGNTYGLNSRPVQPLNGRIISVGHWGRYREGDAPDAELPRAAVRSRGHDDLEAGP